MTQDNHHRIDYLEFPTRDAAESKKFYSHVFGWTFTDYGPEYTSFQDGRLNGGFDATVKGKAGAPLAVLYSRDLGATRERILAAGGTIVRETFSFPGGKRFHFADPGGNELAVWSEE